MNITKDNNAIIIQDIECFDLKHTLDCGQCFHFFEEEDGSYTIVSGDKFSNVSYREGNLIFKSSNLDDVESYWVNYFDLNRDYASLENDLSQKDEYLKKAVDFGSGMRILKQDPYDMVMMFIISANNNIKRITQIIHTLSERYGQCLGECNGRTLYGFPKAEILMNLSVDALRHCGLGYRDKYMKKTSEMLYNKEVVLDDLYDKSLLDIEKSLMTLSGVGKKVADCIALFAYGNAEAFPLDTWVKKILTQYYAVDYKDKKALEQFIKEYFGQTAGFAQQYLFYHIRVEG